MRQSTWSVHWCNNAVLSTYCLAFARFASDEICGWMKTMTRLVMLRNLSDRAFSSSFFFQSIFLQSSITFYRLCSPVNWLTVLLLSSWYGHFKKWSKLSSWPHRQKFFTCFHRMVLLPATSTSRWTRVHPAKIWSILNIATLIELVRR